MPEMKSMTISDLKEHWEDLAEMDLFWAILTDLLRRFGKWDPEEFFRAGECEVQELMRFAKKLGSLCGLRRSAGGGSRLWMWRRQADQGFR